MPVQLFNNCEERMAKTTAKIAFEDENMEDMGEHVRAAADLLKALAHETRLMILCLLVDGEKSVGELERLTLMRQPSVSQQLARLRFDRLVKTRRDGRTIYYSLGSEQAGEVVSLLYNLYCKNKT
jgi:DNA-binding transcriptional ArsR family regulator